jgi:formylglycine-generating enzyme required for sulfatase activity
MKKYEVQPVWHCKSIISIFIIFMLCAVFAACSGDEESSPSSSAIGGNSSTPPEIPGFAFIPSGTFSMGAPATEPGGGYTQHEVTLTKGFYMGKYQVTQELYEAVMLVNPSSFKTGVATSEVQEKRPVETVRWFETLVFCNTLSVLSNLTPVYSISGSADPANWGDVPTGTSHENYATWNTAAMASAANGYRLPTEAEWEYACRAGTVTAFDDGADTYIGIANYDAIVDPLGWYSGNSGSKTHEVGKKAENAWGLYDMHGNVWEWCWDWYEGYSSDAVDDPAGPTSGTARVLRGGSWDTGAQYLRSASRVSNDPSTKSDKAGFRLVRFAP